MILFPEEDSDEIKIGTACKNAGCSKVSGSVPFLNPVAKLLSAQFCFPFLGAFCLLQIDLEMAQSSSGLVSGHL